MKLILVAFLLVSFSSFANDIIKVVDGTAAFCKTKADVLRFQSYGMYRPVKFERSNDSATLTVEFLRCVQDGEDFKFVRDDRFEGRVLTLEAGPFNREGRKVSIERSDIAAVTFSSNGRIYNRGEMKKHADNTYSQTMPIELTNFEADRNGDHFFEMSVSYKVKVTDKETGAVIDSKLEYLGAYRVYLRD